MKTLAARAALLSSLLLGVFPLYAQSVTPQASSPAASAPVALASPVAPSSASSAPSSALPAASPTVIPPAPDEATLKAAALLIDITQTSNMIDQMVPLISKNFGAIVLRDNPGKEAVIGPLVQKSFTTTFATHIDGLKRHLAFIYASKLTREQLEQLIVFYKSPAGQSYLKVMPSLMSQSLVATKAWMTENIHEALRVALDNIKKNNLVVPKELESK